MECAFTIDLQKPRARQETRYGFVHESCDVSIASLVYEYLLGVKLFDGYGKLLQRRRWFEQEELAELSGTTREADKPRGGGRDSRHLRLEVCGVIEHQMPGVSQPNAFGPAIDLNANTPSQDISSQRNYPMGKAKGCYLGTLM